MQEYTIESEIIEQPKLGGMQPAALPGRNCHAKSICKEVKLELVVNFHRSKLANKELAHELMEVLVKYLIEKDEKREL